MRKLEQLKRNIRSEKGSITLFVLVVMLFLLIFFATNFAGTKNKLSVQKKQIIKIQKEYMEDMDVLYDETLEKLNIDVYVSFTKESGGNYTITEWTNENLKMNIFFKDEPEEKNIYIDGEKIEFVDNYLITENCTIEVVYENEGEIKTKKVKVTKIDKDAPNVQIFPNGGVKKIIGDTVTVTAQVKATDGLSGINKIIYAWSTSNEIEPQESEYQETINGGIISKEQPLGTYYLCIKVTDIAGNEKVITSEPYIVREPLPPTINMKLEDENGETFTGNGEWANKNIYTEITMDEIEGTVEKYQYSEDGIEWIDIDGEQKSTIVDYTETYQEGDANRPEIIGNLASADGNNYFVAEAKDDGSYILKSTNHSGSSNAKSYIPIDLTQYTEEDILNITINAEVSSESNYDWGYACATDSITPPTFNKSSTMTGEILKISGTKTATDYTYELKCGKMYYLHFGYYKDGSVDKEKDTFTVNSVNFQADGLGKTINFNGYEKIDNDVSFTIVDEMIKELYIRAVYDDNSYSKVSDVINIKIDKTAPTAKFDYDITSKDTGKIIISNILDKGSGIRGYYISTNEEVPTKESEWIEITENTINIEDLSTGTTYNIWLIDNAGNISTNNVTEISTPNYVVDNSIYTKTLEQAIAVVSDNSEIKLLNNYTDESVATINKNITLNIQEYTLTRTQTITINSSKTVEVIGKGTITGNFSNYIITNNGTLNINMEGKIENSAYGVIRTNSYSAIININKGEIISNYQSSSGYGIYNYYGTTNVEGGTIQGYYGIYCGSSTKTININDGDIIGTGAYGIYGYGTVTINEGTIEGKTRGIFQDSGTLNINGGEIKGDYGVYQYWNSSVNILGGRIEGITYGVYENTSGKITIGSSDTELNTTIPSIYGQGYGVFMSNSTYSFNFYNGIVKSDSEQTTYNGILNTRENYIPYTYYDYDVERKWCTIITPDVAEITITQSPIEFTNEDVQLMVQYPNTEGLTKQFSEDGENWITANNNVYLTNISENKKVYARTLDESGILVERKEYEINNIDKIEPVVTINPETTKYIIYNQEADTVDINVTVTFSDEGVSGIKESKYGWSESKDIEPTEWSNLNSGVTISKTECGVGTYYLWFNISDNAGNTSEIELIRYSVELQEAVAKIGETYYYTIQEAIDAAGMTETTIEIIKDTDEVSTILEGKNIILDLQGHIVGSSTSEQAVFTNNGILQIIDTSEGKTATIENIVGTGIINNGTLTIGDNNTRIDDSTPTISGKKVGIKNNNILNYYDGTIKGKSAISGNVQATPENYGPVGVYENGITIVNLRIVSDYVARIDWFYYTTLQSAIDSCETKINNKTETTVHILKDIVLDKGVETYYGQNIILNLNGYTLTSLKDKVIINNTILTIDDFSEEQIGVITGSDGNTFYGIYNKGIGIINLYKGTITGNNKTSYGIYNEGNGSVNVYEGTINNVDYGIYNIEKGIINVYGGIISAIRNSTVYGIYNKSNGTINIEGGEIQVSSDNYKYDGYGIYNYSLGTINLKQGIIKNANDIGRKFYGIYNYGMGKINVYGGEINGKTNRAYGICNSGMGNINIFGGNIVCSASNAYGIYNTKGKVNIKSGCVNSISTYEGWGICNETSGILNIEGGEVNSTCSYQAYGINNYGILNIKGGKITSNQYGIINWNNGIVNLEEGEIICSDENNGADIISGIYNISSNGIVNMTGGKINCSSSTHMSGVRGIDNYGGIVNIEKGKISSINKGQNDSSRRSSAYGVFVSENGIINIGTKGDGIVSTDIPEIIGINEKETTADNAYGFYNKSGSINFYDGIIKGKTQFGCGTITEIEEGYKIEQEDIDGYDSIYLIEENNTEAVVINEKTSKEYTAIQQAIDEVEDYEVTRLRILSDFIVNPSKFKISENKNIILDLAGNKVTNRYNNVINEGTLKIEDSIGEGELIFENSIRCIENSGMLTIKVNIRSNSSSDFYGIYNNDGTVILESGKIDSTSSNFYSYGIYNNNNGVVDVYGGTINVRSLNDAHGIYNIKGIINLWGGTINCYSVTYRSTGIYNGMYNSYDAYINIYGGTINCDAGNHSPINGIENQYTGTINVYGGIINCGFNTTSAANCYGINNNSTGTVNVEGGKISCNSTRATVYGIYNYSTGTIEIGTKGDGIVERDNPEIKGMYEGTYTSYKGYGLYNIKGITNFYDGRIEGSTTALSEGTEITEIEKNTSLLYENEDKILTLTTEEMDIAKIGDVTYSSLQEAINAAGTTQTTIELLRGIQLTNADTTVTVAEGQNIILDLKGFSIISAVEDAVITNNGTLEIIDSSEGVTGKISGSYENTIYNKQGATLELNAGTVTRKLSKDNVVYNEGTVNVTGATISNPGTESYSIYNTETAILTITSGEIIGGTKGICNIGTANIINGTIERGIKNSGLGILNIENMTCTGEISNTENASIKMTGGEIRAGFYEKYGIFNTSTNTVTITGGRLTVTGLNTAISKVIYSTAGTINIGTKDGNILTDVPEIIAEEIAIEVSPESTLNFYDGILKGKVSVIQGNVTEIEENAEIVVGTEEDYETISLISKDIALAEVNGNQYYSLTEAVDSISDTGTIKILREGTVENTINILSGKNITINLNGNNLKMYNRFENSGNLTITDTSESKTGSLYSYKDSPIYNNGTLTIAGGNISGNTYGVYNQGNGNVQLTGGTITNNTYGIYLTGGNANIIGGTISNNTYGIFTSSGITNITNVNLIENEYGIYNSYGTTNITAENIVLSNNTNDIYNGGTGTINVISGNISTTNLTLIENISLGTIVIGTQDGNVITNSPIIQAEEYAIKNSSTGAIKFYDGTIKGKVGALKGLYLYLETGYKVKTEYKEGYYCDSLTLAGTVTTVAKIGTTEYGHLQSAINACISEEATTITLVNSINTDTTFVVEEGQNIILDLNGKNIITSTEECIIRNEGNLTIIDSSTAQTGKISSSHTVAINNSGTLALGENDGEVEETPEISGTTNAIINNGTLNFYDGIIKATGTPIDGTITNRATGYIVVSQTIDGVQQLKLSK